MEDATGKNTMRVGTKVVFVAPDVSHRKVGSLGTIVDTSFIGYLVEWDDGDTSFVIPEAIEPIHRLKAMFKHGPKINKRDL